MDILILGELDSDSHCRVIFDQKVSDETLWQGIEPQWYVDQVIPRLHQSQFTHRGGCIVLEDIPDPVPQFHYIKITAWHVKEQYLTWLEMVSTKN
jgi:hypothetical protein